MKKHATQIWILNHYAASPDVPGGTRHFELSRQLVERGYDVTILASNYSHKKREKTRLAEGGTWEVEEIDGVKFVWLQSVPYYRNDWRRVANMLSYTLRSYWVGRRLPKLDSSIPAPDTIIGSSVHLLTVLSACFLARRFDAHFVMEVRDLWPQTLVDMGALSEESLLTKGLRRLEKYLYTHAERIIVLLPSAQEYIAGVGVDGGKTRWIPNGVDLSRYPATEPTTGKDGPFTVMYAGAHGRANGLDVVIDAAKKVQDRGYGDIRFVFVGDGPEKSRLEAYGQELDLQNIEFLMPVAKAEIPHVLAQADVLVFPLKDIAVFKYGISSNKLFDYLAAGRPVIFASAATNNIVEEARSGLSVPPENAEALAGAVIQLYEMPLEEREATGLRGRAHVEQHHDYAILAQRLADVLDELDNSPEVG